MYVQSTYITTPNQHITLNTYVLCILFELMREWKMRHVKLMRQMNGMITIIFQKGTLFLVLKDEMRLCKGRRVTLTSRILHSSMSSNRKHSSYVTEPMFNETRLRSHFPHNPKTLCRFNRME